MRLGARPTLETLAAFAVVFVLQGLFGAAGWEEVFVLDPSSVLDRPWTAVTSVYAHAHPGHLLANAVALAVVGPLVARRTTTWAFHAFFVATGALAGIAEVVLGSFVGPANGVLGASGAVFALLGYLLSGNVVSTVLLDRIALSARAQFLLFLAVAVLVTLATAGSQVALFGHGTGLLLGLLAGRGRLIDASGRSDRSGRSRRAGGP